MNSIRNCSSHPLVGWGIYSAAARLSTMNVFSLIKQTKPCCTICRTIHYQNVNQSIISNRVLCSKRFYHSGQRVHLKFMGVLPLNQPSIGCHLRQRFRTKATIVGLSAAQSGKAQPASQDSQDHDPPYKPSNQMPMPQSTGNQDFEGPVMHLSSAAALVLTNNNISVSNNGRKDVHGPSTYDTTLPKFVFIDNNSQRMSEEVLLSHTTAYVRRVSRLGATDESGDIEYVVESKISNAPKSGLSGALPASSLEWRTVGSAQDTFGLPALYAALAKSRLTGLVVTTALGGYVLSPMPFSVVSVVGVCLGTGLISASANTTNQILEMPYDAQMRRTANRVLVKGLLTPLHAAGFAAVCGAGGIGVLWGACNPLTAVLGATNLLLYTSVYTPMKRKTIANTWMGAVVGAIPPLMGWCGSGASLWGTESYGAWLMAGLLFAWQFPHFNALSWNLRPDYSRAGYRMMCVTNPRLCKMTCVRYSLAMLAIGVAAPALGVTTWTFAIDSTPLNMIMLYLSYRFYRDGDSNSSRNLFRFSLVHLPAVIVLMLISKKYSRDAAASKQQDLASLTDITPSSGGGNVGANVYNSKVVYNKSVAAPTLPVTESTSINRSEAQSNNDSCVNGGLSVSAESRRYGTDTQRPTALTVVDEIATSEGGPNAGLAINFNDDRCTFLSSSTPEEGHSLR